MFYGIGQQETVPAKKAQLEAKREQEYKIAYNCIRNLNAMFKQNKIDKRIIMTPVIEGDMVGLRAWVQPA